MFLNPNGIQIHPPRVGGARRPGEERQRQERGCGNAQPQHVKLHRSSNHSGSHPFPLAATGPADTVALRRRAEHLLRRHQDSALCLHSMTPGQRRVGVFSPACRLFETLLTALPVAGRRHPEPARNPNG